MKTILFAVLIALSGCSGDDGSSASDEMRDCRNAGLECGEGFECRENAKGVFECASAMTPSGGVSAPNAAPSGGVNMVPVGGMNPGGSPTNRVAGVPAGGGSPTSTAGGVPAGGGSPTSTAGGVPGGGGTPMAGGQAQAGGTDAGVQSSFPSGASRDVQIDGHPGRVFDVYMPTIKPRQVVIFLHGGAGSKEGSADHLRLSGISQEALDETRTAWILPQGANANGPGTPTWSNYVMDSGYQGPNGEDDVAFLTGLAGWARSELLSDTVVLGGHSNGGMMTHRIWCEADGLFDRFLSVAGPPSAEFNPNEISPRDCRGSKPYWAILGTEDGVLQNQDLDAEIWTIAPAAQNEAFLNPNLLNERFAHTALRRVAVCPNNPTVDEIDDGPRSVFSSCRGRLQVWFIRPPRGERIRGVGQHPISTLEEHGGFTLRGLIVDWEQE